LAAVPAPPATRTRRRIALVVSVLAGFVVLGGCLPTQAATGRATPVRRVLVLGDSMTWGLYGISPQLVQPLGRQLMQRDIFLDVEGFPGESPLDMWPGHAPWSERLQALIDAKDPDMVVIQSVLFVGSDDQGRRDAYATAIRQLFDIAQSKGAHVYIVSHHPAVDALARHEMEVAQQMQADAAAGRGIETIPLDWWLARCTQPFLLDGWHLTATGEECHADAVIAAVDQLRKVVG
jgi:hypothetical protein